MNDYDFLTLNDKEFENISIELVSRDQKKRFERFKPGRDEGVDGRFYSNDNHEEIIQCKHYLKTGYAGFIRTLKNDEKIKVNKLKPKRYYLTTSLPLSRKNKQEIKKIFEPYMIRENDIYGQEDLNDLLRENPDIEERYYKLWISSTNILKTIFNNSIKGRSRFELEEIKEKTKLYVVTSKHFEAQKKLEDTHTIIIAGEPGIGKTTIAEQLSLIYVAQGFEFCMIENSINEAESIYQEDVKQLFYFDDFLGANYLEALEFHQDSHIVKFIKRIKKDRNKRFILTSRTNILNQGLSLSDNFRNGKIEKDEFIIKIEDLSEMEKAKILYNHIWHSDLDKKYIDELYKEKRYKEIIKHKNFNPRIIEFITDMDRLDNIKVNEYWGFILQKLNDPSDIWAQTFDQGCDEFMRNIVALTVFNGSKIEEKFLIESYNRLIKQIDLKNHTNSSKDFNSVIKTVVKYFLNRSKIYKKTIEYSLFNPSIADFVINRYRYDEERLLNLFISLKSPESLKVLTSLYKTNTISKKIYKNVILKLYEIIEYIDHESHNNIDFSILLFEALGDEIFDGDYTQDKMIHFFKSIITNNTITTQIIAFIDVLTNLIREEKINIESYQFLISIIDSIDDDIYELNSIIDFIQEFNVKDENIILSLNNCVQQYLIYTLDGMMYDLDYGDIDFNFDHEGNAFLSTDLYSLMDDLLTNAISEISYSDMIDIDESSIINEIDIDHIEEKLINSYYESFNYEESDIRTGVQTSYAQDIDDLFER